MEEPKILKPGKRRIPDVGDSTDECLPYTNDHRIVSSPEKIIGTQGPDSPVSLVSDSFYTLTPNSSISSDSDVDLSSPEPPLKKLCVDVNDACRMSQGNVMSSR